MIGATDNDMKKNGAPQGGCVALRRAVSVDATPRGAREGRRTTWSGAASRSVTRCARLDAGLVPVLFGPHQLRRCLAKPNQARTAGKGRCASILARSVLAFGCAPHAACGGPLPAFLVRLIVPAIPRRNSCVPMHRNKANQNHRQCNLLRFPLLNLCIPMTFERAGW